MTNRVVVAPLVLVEVACVRIAVGQHHSYTYRVLRFLIRRYRPFFFFAPLAVGKLKKKKNQTVSFLSFIYLPRIEIIGFYDVQAVSSVVERLALNQEAVSSILTPLRIKKKLESQASKLIHLLRPALPRCILSCVE